MKKLDELILKPIKIHNNLAEARYSMNISEQKLFIFAIKNIDQENNNFMESTFNISNFAKYADLDVKHLYKEIDTMTENIMKTIIYIRHSDDKDRWIKYNLTSKCEYNKGNITFRFNNDMKPLLLKLQRHYFLQAPEVLSFKSWYSIRIYDFLKSKSYINNAIEISLDDLKTILDIEGKYQRFSNFRARVINVAVDEINDNSDIFVKCENIYEGRSAVGLKFDVIDKSHQYIQLIENTYDIETFKEKAGLSDECFSSQQIIDLYETACERFTNYKDSDDIFIYMRLSFDYTKNKKTDGNLFGYYRSVLANDYAKAIPMIMNNYIFK